MFNIEKLKKEQLKLAKKVVIKDDFSKIETVAGCDQAYVGDKVVSGVVVCDYKTKEVIEKADSVKKAVVPYIPGYLSYREAPAIIEAFNKLDNKPDILIVDGNGILHFRKIGMASHVGILLDIPAIGVAKKLLCGDVKEGKVYLNDDVCARELMTKEHSRPIYVSPGHRVSMRTSLEVVKNLIQFPHKLPEPLHLAHKYANEVKDKLNE